MKSIGGDSANISRPNIRLTWLKMSSWMASASTWYLHFVQEAVANEPGRKNDCQQEGETICLRRERLVEMKGLVEALRDQRTMKQKNCIKMGKANTQNIKCRNSANGDISRWSKQSEESPSIKLG